MTAKAAELNGAPGIVFRGAGRVLATPTLDLGEDGSVTDTGAVPVVANPDKLRAASARTVHPIG